MRKILMVIVLLLGGAFTSFAQSGYRGFADISLGAGFNEEYGFNGMITTTHGYQCNGHIFVGGGVGFGYSSAEYCDWTGYDEYFEIGAMLPIYAALRYDYSLISRHSFFASVRGGYETLYSGGFFAPELGVRFGSFSKISYNLSMRSDFIFGRDLGFYPTVLVSFGIEF